jgi:hypothetical protein
MLRTPSAARNMRNLLLLSILGIVLWIFCCQASVHAADAIPPRADKKRVAREIGAILGWRLGPEALEERCRSADPDGAEARAKLLQAWREKNARLIEAVDTRIAEIVPLMTPPAAGVDAVQAVHAQVKELILEPMFSGRSAEESTTICKAESNPTNTRWTSNGLPHVQQSLAELYDWQVARGEK